MIIGTAGHIDHGKSALVTALTGRTVDRLREEQRRGITIDLNFAPLALDGLPPVGIVDVPGHEDFVRTMVAGASGIDLVLLVVDSAEGIRPQTLEHLAVVEQLGIPQGLPVLTKADLVEQEWLDLVRADLEQRLAVSPIAFGEPAVVSALTGTGVDALRRRIAGLAAAARTRRADDLFRMPVDRVFALAGVGTVVTGTTWSGSLRVGDEVVLEPGRRAARIRSIECYGDAVPRAIPGARTALGLTGVSRNEVARGDVVLQTGAGWRTVRAFDALVRLLPDAPGSLAHHDRVRVHHGTAEVMARVHPRSALDPGGEGLARLSLEAPMVLRGDDRFVLRRYSPVSTIGGGVVLDPSPPPRAPWPAVIERETGAARLPALVERRVAGIPDLELPVIIGCPPSAAQEVAKAAPELDRVGDRWVPLARVYAAESRFLERLRDFHQAEPSSPGLSLETLRKDLRSSAWLSDHVVERLVRLGRVQVSGSVVALAGFQPYAGGGEEEVRQVVDALEAAGLEPPPTRELGERLALRDLTGAIRIAASQGLVEQVERDRYFARNALNRFLEAVRDAGRTGEVVPAVLRERLGLSRKFLIPLLEWSDRKGVTWRDSAGVRRVRG